MNSIFNLKTTLSQGSGFGAMTTIIDSIKSLLVPIEESHYKIDKGLFDLLLENNRHTKSMIRGLEQAVFQLDRKLDLLPIQSSEIIQEIPGIAEQLESHIKNKGLKINLPIFKGDMSLSGDLLIKNRPKGIIIKCNQVCATQLKHRHFCYFGGRLFLFIN